MTTHSATSHSSPRGNSPTHRTCTHAATSVRNRRPPTRTLAIAGGTSVFEITESTTFDKVLVAGDADVVLGGVLRIETPGSFTDFGDYVIIDLNGGAASGTFSRVIPPELDPPLKAGARVEIEETEYSP